MTEPEYNIHNSVFFMMGDIARAFAIISLPLKILWTKNCAGISGKTQLLYALIFITRYVNITFNNFTIQMIFGVGFTCSTLVTLLLIYYFRKTYELKNDYFRIELLLLPSIFLAAPYPYCFSSKISYIQSLQVFSVVLESVALVPQTFFTTKRNKIHSVVAYYIAFLSLSAIMYIGYCVSPSTANQRIFLVSNIVQLMFCCDYFMKNMLCFRSTQTFEFNDQETGDAIPMNANSS